MKQKIAHIVKTTITFTCWSIITSLMTLTGLPFALLPAKYRYSCRLYYWIMGTGAKLMIKTTFITMLIKGEKSLKTNLHHPSIIICNHSSAIDIPLVQMLVGAQPHVWFSKAAYAKIPIFGFILRRMNILVKRESVTKCAQTIEQAHAITNGRKNHLLMFPEGMRHHDGQIHRFLPGFAVLAQELNRPIIPIMAYGLHKIFPKKSKLIHSAAANVTISIGQPMWYTSPETRQDFIARVKTWYDEELERLKKSS